MEPIKFIFTLIGAKEVKTDIVGYLPFEGAEFCAHRDTWNPDEWRIAHVRTTFRVPGCFPANMGEAVTLAERLSRGCPSASKIERVPGNDGSLGFHSGPTAKLRAEVLAVLEAA